MLKRTYRINEAFGIGSKIRSAAANALYALLSVSEVCFSA